MRAADDREPGQRAYFLRVAAIGYGFEHAIEPCRFAAIADAFECLRQVVRIEEQWDAVIQNYLDLERNLLETAARSMVVYDFDIQVFNDLRLRFGVRLSNLLSTCRAYIDQTPQRLGTLGLAGMDNAGFKVLTSAQYDGRFGYRVMEALRNHAQHHGLPIHGATYGQGRVEGSSRSTMKYSIATNIHLEELSENPGFKKTVLRELRESAHPHNRVASESYIREYIEGLSEIHDQMRSALADDVARWVVVIRDAVNHFRTVAGTSNVFALSAFEIDEREQPLREIPITTGMIERVEILQKRNRHLVNLSKRFVTSAID